MTPEMTSTFVEPYQVESRKQRRAAHATRDKAEQDLAQITREIDNIVEAIAQGMFQASMKERMDALEARKAELEATIGAHPKEDTVLLHPSLAEQFRRKVEDLVSSINDPALKTEAGDLLHSLIDKIILTMRPKGHRVALQGELAGILSFCENGMATNANTRSKATGVREVPLVAGGRTGLWRTFLMVG
ncbi:hypothetical protein [Thalassorhabdomicrobium marinisediminis]|uniref:hypothetical protein n=1 Tax=Thalassorhabdomicrobium marinisediminis TaxID=2170577 RepID=UPI002492731F|nr:hypothetical protein [Thalassorhabdomicrobium marinisediminis]